MPSPFPGMNPYLEAPVRWLDFHNNLVGEIQAALNRVLDPRYAAALTSDVAYETVEISPRPRNPRWADAGVVRTGPAPNDLSGTVATIVPTPFESSIPWEIPMMLDRVEILTTVGEQLV